MAAADPRELAARGISIPEDGTGYSYGVRDVHPELSPDWAEGGRIRPGWDNPERRLSPAGTYADMEHEALMIGAERSQHQKWVRDHHKGSLTQGGQGLRTTEFPSYIGLRAKGRGTHQFAVQFRTLEPGRWQITKWRGKHECIRRDFWFTSERQPVHLFNRFIDRVRTAGVSTAAEIELVGRSCVVWLTTTWAQGVSQLDFELARFLDKEHRLMWRPDWTPVVVRRDESGEPINFRYRDVDVEQVPEGLDREQTDSLMPAREMQALAHSLKCGWEISTAWSHPGTSFVVELELKSVYRVMDLVNRLCERCEELGRYYDGLRIYPNSLKISLGAGGGFTYRDAALAVHIDSLAEAHANYLDQSWAAHPGKQEPGNRALQDRLADTAGAPRSWFRKTPLGDGTGPMRKVMFEMPADMDKAYKKMGWGRPPEGIRPHFPVAWIDPDKPRPSQERLEKMAEKDARDRGLDKKSKGVDLEDLPSILRKGIQSKERMTCAPALD
eukprot:TRINITY_DN55255_c0_g1_i1.p1 TRINITY_DN55255_c0_g1~~TRINITY_DN55255_c0_g1_i1.p1  ORF type:complete len:574 (+),score=121.94 TRINITY_DN55255_c0_g1_i1:231-1724(+)